MEGAGDVFLINHNADSALITLRYRFPGASFEAAEEPFEAGGHKFNRGSFIVRNVSGRRTWQSRHGAWRPGLCGIFRAECEDSPGQGRAYRDHAHLVQHAAGGMVAG